MRDFSSQMYASFLNGVREAGYRTVSIAQWSAGVRYPYTIILRHDVDRMPSRALALAKLEQEHGVTSSYYFRYKRTVFRPGIVSRIAAMGHEIGYHYEVMADAGGDPEKAKILFGKNLAAMRKICPVQTAAMHGRPLSPYRETDFWTHADLTDYALQAEAYLPFEGCALPYLTDTGRTWRDGVNNIRDEISGSPDLNISTTPELINLMRSRKHPTLYLSFHPERWPSGTLACLLSAVQDRTLNFIKRAIRTRYA